MCMNNTVGIAKGKQKYKVIFVLIDSYEMFKGFVELIEQNVTRNNNDLINDKNVIYRYLHDTFQLHGYSIKTTKVICHVITYNERLADLRNTVESMGFKLEYYKGGK